MSHVWTYQCGSRRSIEYGSTVARHDGLLLGLQVVELDEPVAVDRLGQHVDEPLLLADVRRGGLGQLEDAERLLELRAHAVER